MEITKVIYGIDISSESFTVSHGVLYQNTESKVSYTRTFNNNENGFKSFIKFTVSLEKKYISGNQTQLWFLMESTGVYYENLAYFLNNLGFNVSVVLANKMKNFSRTLTTKSKTDKIDSQTITTYGIEKQLQKWESPSADMKRLKELTREVNDLNKLINMSKNKLHAKHHSYKADASVIKRIKEHIKFLKKHIVQIKKEIGQLVKENKVFCEKIKNISVIKGVKTFTIASVVAETDEFKLIKNKRQLVSYAGLDIIQDQSGKSEKKTKLSKKGNSHIRKALYMPALSSIKHEKKLKLQYERQCKRYNWKDKKRAVMAVMRKLLILIYTLWKNDSVYDPEYYKKERICFQN